MIATTAFEKAAEAQAVSLGFEPGIVYVPHPIQDRTNAEIRAIAEDAFADILGMITAR